MFDDLNVLAGRLAGGAAGGPDASDPPSGNPSELDPDGALVEALVGVEKVKAAAEARSMLLMAELCRRAQRWVPTSGWSSEDLSAEELAGEEIASALRLAPGTAALRVHRAAQIAIRLPGTLAALARGDLDVGRVLAIYDATMPLSDELAGRVEQVVLPGASDQTAGELRAALRRAVIAADPAAAETRRKAAVRDRSVRRYCRPDGMSAMEAVLSAIDTGEIYELLDEVARQSKTAGDARSMDARRADAFVFLMLGRDPYLGPEDPLPPPPASPPPDPDDEPTPSWQQPPDDCNQESDQRPTGEPADEPAAEPADEGAKTPTDTADTGTEPADVPADEEANTPTDTADTGTETADRTGGRDDRERAPIPAEPVDLDERFPPEVDPAAVLSKQVARCLAAVLARRPPRLPWVCIHPVIGPGGRPVMVAELQGVGAITAEAAQQLLDAGAARPPPAIGSSYVVTAAQARAHDPPPGLADHVRARDGTCRFPCCRRSANRCDLDHTERHPEGPTVAENLAALCRRHHRVKHRGGWVVRQTTGATLLWTSATGRSYETYARGFDGSWRGAALRPATAPDVQDPPHGSAPDSLAA